MLDETDGWTKNYFDPKKAKSHRREVFFANPIVAWSSKAPRDEDVFIGEGTRGSGRRRKTPPKSGKKRVGKAKSDHSRVKTPKKTAVRPSRKKRTPNQKKR